MKILVTGKQLDIGDALRAHVDSSLDATVGKYFGNVIEAHVVLSREAHRFRSDISVHVGRGIRLQGHAEAEDAYAAFDSAAERIAKRLRRHKRRLRDHHTVKSVQEEGLTAQQYILAGTNEEEAEAEADNHPVVIAEMTTEIATLTVGEAVMRLDLADMPAMMFRNSAHGGLNVVFRRPDGNIGWIDPADSDTSAPRA